MPGTVPSNEETPSPGSGATRRPPNFKLCRAKLAGFGDYVDCMVAKPEQCIFSLAFGDSYLCLHSKRRDIAARTDAEQSGGIRPREKEKVNPGNPFQFSEPTGPPEAGPTPSSVELPDEIPRAPGTDRAP